MSVTINDTKNSTPSTATGRAARCSHRYFLCSETHWDREWHGSFDQFRMRMVRMFDTLLDILEKDPEFRCFNLDGQASLVEDYLEIKPQNEETIRRHIQQGRIVIGPWYILPDEFLVSGESTIRNLMRGAIIGRRFGKISGVGYLPDMFGHISQMPQILKQWGIDVALLWRGLSGNDYKNELVWRSPDGSEVVLAHIMEEMGYCSAALFVASLPPSLRGEYLSMGYAPNDILSGEDAVRVLVEACSFVRDRSIGDCHVLLNGVDHMGPNPEIPDLIREANRRLDGEEIVQASFDDYAAALLESVKGKNLQIVEGELRDTIWTRNGAGIILNGILSSRIYLKQQNQECCTLLENWVEPFTTINTLLGASSQKDFIDTAWCFVLNNHPHDSIGGCSVDAVHRQMEHRFERAHEIGESLLEFTFTEILEKVRLEGTRDGEYYFAVFNPSQEAQSGWVRAELEIPWPIAPTPPNKQYKGIMITDANGVEQPSWLISYNPAKPVNRPSLRAFYVAPERPVFDISFWAESIPTCGYKIFRFRPLEKPHCVFGTLSPERNVLENEHLRATINPNGTVRLTDKATGFTYENLHYMEDSGDNGCEYAYSFPKDDQVYSTLSSSAEVALVENSLARVAYKVILTLNLPESMDASKQSRSDNKRSLVIESIISLGAGSRRLDIETTVTNTVKDHRLRVLFPTYLDTDCSSAESQFDVVDHPIIIEQPPLEIWKEDQPKLFSQRAFVSVSDGKKGLAIANIGLPEYQVTPDRERAIAITLMRAVSHISNAWMNTMMHGAGCPAETPEAQMLGRKLVFKYSIIPHPGQWNESRVQLEAHNFAAGLRAFPVLYSNGLQGNLPSELSFISVDGENIMLSSVKSCEDGEGLVVRLWNSSEKPSRATLSLFRKHVRAFVSNIKEERIEELPTSDVLELAVEPKRIVTIRLEFDESRRVRKANVKR